MDCRINRLLKIIMRKNFEARVVILTVVCFSILSCNSSTSSNCDNLVEESVSFCQLEVRELYLMCTECASTNENLTVYQRFSERALTLSNEIHARSKSHMEFDERILKMVKDLISETDDKFELKDFYSENELTNNYSECSFALYDLYLLGKLRYFMYSLTIKTCRASDKMSLYYPPIYKIGDYDERLNEESSLGH